MFNKYAKKSFSSNTVKCISALPWASLSSLGSTKTIERPDFIDIRDILESDELDTVERAKKVAEAENINRSLQYNYKKTKALNNSEDKSKDLPLLVPFKEEWVLPHLMTFFGTGQCKPILVDGIIDLKASLTSLITKARDGNLVFSNGTRVTTDALVGMIRFMKVSPRGSIMPKGMTQGSPQGHRYSACVPLLFSAWKSYQNIQYKQYDYTLPIMEHVLEDDLIELMQYVGSEVPWTSDELSAFKAQALYIKTTGAYRTVANCTMVYSTGNKEFDDLPKLVKLLLLQLWVFQPELYKPYAIQNLMDVDAPAINLVSTDIFSAPEPKLEKSSHFIKKLVPWE